MRIVLVVLISFMCSIIIAQDLDKPNWAAYYFEGINVWDFDSTGWDAYIHTRDDGDDLTIEYLRFFKEQKLNQFDFVKFTYDQNYHFYIWCPDYKTYKSFLDILFRDFGKPFESVKVFNKWYVDEYRTVELFGGSVYDTCRGDIGEEMEIIFKWGSYSNPHIRRLFENTFPILKNEEEAKREYQLAQIQREDEQHRESKEIERKNKLNDEIAKNESEVKKLAKRESLSSKKVVGSWVYKGQVIDVLDIWSNNKCSYRSMICTWSITEDKELEICGKYNCHYFILEDDNLILDAEYMNGEKHPVNVNVIYEKAKYD